MTLALILALVVALYWRTLDYNYVIDDNVKRDGYMYEVPFEGPPPSLWKSKPPKLYRLFMIGMHCVNVSVIYLLWGWAPALLFAVHPLGVWGTAWVTGNYYATTAYFCLIAYYILHVFPNIYGALAAMALFTAALNSTVCCISFPFLFFFIGTPWGLTLLFPLAMYLRGRRFRTGIATRLSFNKNKPVDAKFTWRRLLVMTKVVARYIHVCLMPERLGFFRLFGSELHTNQKRYDWAHKVNTEFWMSLGVCLSLFIGGLYINPVGTLWFFGIMLLHSQWNLTGQFFAERYAYLPLVGLCVVAGTMLQHYPIAMAAVVTYLVYRTHKFIPAWENQEAVWRNDLESFPENPQVHGNLGQWYMNNSDKTQELKAYQVNEIAMLLQKAHSMCPTQWEASMNMACFSVMIGRIEEGLDFTHKAYDLLEPIAGGSGQHALNKLRDQIERLEGVIKEKQGRIGADKESPSLTLPAGNSAEQNKEKENDKNKTESSKEVTQPA